MPYRPASQVPEHDGDDIAEELPYEPAGQSMHTDAPAKEYLPAPHATAVGDVDPAAQMWPPMHAAVHCDDVLPLVEPYRPASHGPEHDGEFRPVAAPYVPAGHSVHVPAPARLYCPIAHAAVQLDAVCAASPYRPARQLPLHAAVVRPCEPPKVPPGHGVHAEAPAVLNLPTEQGPVHVLATAPGVLP
jgi:hypothetical protein